MILVPKNAIAIAKPTSSIGFSFSPGGLLLPYHMGVANCLIQKQYLDPTKSILAGSSAGSIAAMAIGCGLDPLLGLEGTISISDNCIHRGVKARGNLLPLLEEQMNILVGDNEFDFLQQRQQQLMSQTDNNNDKLGTGVCIAYKEIFPLRKSYFQTKFDTKEDLFRTVGYSCMFPFFTTNWPFIIEMNNNDNDNDNDNDNNKPGSSSSRLQLPRFVMDGYFTVPREQFGCPILQKDVFPDVTLADGSGLVDRTVAITCIPQEIFGMDTIFNNDNDDKNDDSNNLISISTDDEFTVSDIFRIAIEPTSREELTDLYERGYRDGEKWCRKEEEKLSQRQ